MRWPPSIIDCDTKIEAQDGLFDGKFRGSKITYIGNQVII